MQVFDVVIIGGGAAGLSAADYVRRERHDLSIAILEAQDRFGGRTCTVSSENGDAVDVGGQWVGPTQTKVLRLLDKYNIGKTEQTFSTPIPLPTGEVRARYVEVINMNLVPLSDEEKLEVLSFEKKVIEICDKMDASKPWEVENAVELDGMSAKEYIETNIKLKGAIIELLLFVQGMVSCDPKDCSFLFFIFFVKSSGGFEALGDGPNGMQKWKLKGGFQQVCDRYSEELENLGVRKYKNHFVLSIAKVNGIFRITTVGDNVFTAKKIIIAMSPALAVRTISFDEGLIHPDQLTLYNGILPGRAVKIILSYRQEFWNTDTHKFPPVSVDDLTTFLAHNIFPTTVGSNPGLILLLTGAAVEKYTLISSEKGAEGALQEIFLQLSHLYDCPIGITSNPVECFEKNWALEKHAFGCFAGFYPPNYMTLYGPHIRPASQGIFWAATETSSEFYGYVEGALRAGEYAAKQLVDDIE